MPRALLNVAESLFSELIRKKFEKTTMVLKIVSNIMARRSQVDESDSILCSLEAIYEQEIILKSLLR